MIESLIPPSDLGSSSPFVCDGIAITSLYYYISDRRRYAYEALVRFLKRLIASFRFLFAGILYSLSLGCRPCERIREFKITKLRAAVHLFLN